MKIPISARLACPVTKLRMKEKKPITRVSSNVIANEADINCLYIGVLSLTLGFINPRCSIVARLPENIPPIPPRMVNIGGNNAGIHNAFGNSVMNNEISLPAKRLIILNDKAIRV